MNVNTSFQEASMNRNSNSEILLPLRPAWKRLVVFSLSLLQSFVFVPALGYKQFFPPAAEAAESSGGAGGRSKRTQFKATDGQRRESMLKKVLRGKASWYGPGFHGRKTANGEIFDQRKLTAAHKTLPLGTKAIVRNVDNGNTVEVEINDRGPYVPGRMIDLSYAAAKQLGFLKSGTALVEVLPLVEEVG
jgi:rare lipoprotein A (peptidoglycan hydrolase)